jgi:heme exporter protein D
MSENELIPETEAGPCPTACGDYGPVQVEMRDTLGVIALAIVSVLLLRALLQEQARNRALRERLVLLQGEVE